MRLQTFKVIYTIARPGKTTCGSKDYLWLKHTFVLYGNRTRTHSAAVNRAATAPIVTSRVDLKITLVEKCETLRRAYLIHTIFNRCE